MTFTQAGIILFTQHYADCIRFYRDGLGLKLLHHIDHPGERLTTFALGDTYLMVEPGGRAHDGPKSIDTSPFKFRFNVPDVQATCDHLHRKGIATTLFTHTWGTTAEFHDPDGNCCALRSDAGFGT